jgi:transglutaminase-like putative cysteine protease
MRDLIGLHLGQWTKAKSRREALIAVFNHIRDIPYCVLPELNHPQHYQRILEIHAGSCTPKHLLMAEMCRRLGRDVLLAIYPYRWAEFEDLYPPRLRKLARLMPPGSHLACKVLINGRYVLMDATVDPPLGRIGLPVNECWDGESDTSLPVLPTGDEEIYHPSEVLLMLPPRLDTVARTFYAGLNEYFGRIRRGQP